MTCNPLVVHIDNQWQAWCRACHWETPWTSTYSLATTWRNQHEEAA